MTSFKLAAILLLALNACGTSTGWDSGGTISPRLDLPETTIDSAPLDGELVRDAVFTFSSNDEKATFECRLDDGTFAACESGVSITDLSSGPHRFEVRARVACHTDGTPALVEWTIVKDSVTQVSTGMWHTCAIYDQGNLFCWGRNYYGQLGFSTEGSQNTPRPVTPEAEWAQVSAGEYHTCAVKVDGTLWCWGANGGGRLGDGSTTQKAEPTQESTKASDWSAVDAGDGHTCALKENGRLFCWGSNYYGQLGYSTGIENPSEDRAVNPGRVGTAEDWAEISAGSSHTCARKEDGRLLCWGRNASGELGIGVLDTTNPLVRHETPEAVLGATDWSGVSTGSSMTCGVRGAASLECWGESTLGVLGLGDVAADVSTPQVVATGFAEVSAGSFVACATQSDGSLWCWGNNTAGMLAVGTGLDPQTVPAPVGGDDDWLSVAAGGFHVCGIRATGKLFCWGSNGDGQVGNGESGPNVRQITLYQVSTGD